MSITVPERHGSRSVSLPDGPTGKVAGNMPGKNDSQTVSKRAGLSPKTPLLHEDMHDHVAAPARAKPRSGRFSRTLLNFWLDGLLGVVFAALCLTAVIVQFVFPAGIAARDWFLWGMSYGQWCSIQFALVAVLGLGVLVHIMLHWQWVCSVWTKRVLRRQQLPDDGIRTVYGVGLLICVLMFGAVVVGVAQWMIVRPQ